MELIRHIADVVGEEGVFSLHKFRSSAVRRSLSFCFWYGKNLVMLALTTCSRDIAVVKGNVPMVAQLLSVVSTDSLFCVVEVPTSILSGS